MMHPTVPVSVVRRARRTGRRAAWHSTVAGGLVLWALGGCVHSPSRLFSNLERSKPGQAGSSKATDRTSASTSRGAVSPSHVYVNDPFLNETEEKTPAIRVASNTEAAPPAAGREKARPGAKPPITSDPEPARAKAVEASAERIMQPRSSQEARQAADQLIHRARHAIDQGRWDDARALSIRARDLERTHRLRYRPSEERPSDFIARLDHLRAVYQSGTAVKSAGAPRPAQPGTEPATEASRVATVAATDNTSSDETNASKSRSAISPAESWSPSDNPRSKARKSATPVADSERQGRRIPGDAAPSHSKPSASADAAPENTGDLTSSQAPTATVPGESRVPQTEFLPEPEAAGPASADLPAQEKSREVAPAHQIPQDGTLAGVPLKHTPAEPARPAAPIRGSRTGIAQTPVAGHASKPAGVNREILIRPAQTRDVDVAAPAAPALPGSNAATRRPLPPSQAPGDRPGPDGKAPASNNPVITPSPSTASAKSNRPAGVRTIPLDDPEPISMAAATLPNPTAGGPAVSAEEADQATAAAATPVPVTAPPPAAPVHAVPPLVAEQAPLAPPPFESNVGPQLVPPSPAAQVATAQQHSPLAAPVAVDPPPAPAIAAQVSAAVPALDASAASREETRSAQRVFLAKIGLAIGFLGLAGLFLWNHLERKSFRPQLKRLRAYTHKPPTTPDEPVEHTAKPEAPRKAA